jgi:hypothetical protein
VSRIIQWPVSSKWQVVEVNGKHKKKSFRETAPGKLLIIDFCLFRRLGTGVSKKVKRLSVVGKANTNKIEKVYSLENTNIPKTFFTLHHVGSSCTNVIPVHCCTLGHS